MWNSLRVKFLLFVFPIFVVVSAGSLAWLAEYSVRQKLEDLTARVGNHAGHVANAVGRSKILQDEGVASRVLATLLADRAVQCVELNIADPNALQILVPRGLGCRGQDPGERLALGLTGVPNSNLIVQFSTREIDEARIASRELSLLVTVLGFVFAAGASLIGFQWTVGRPLGRLLTAIKETSASGHFPIVNRVGADEIGQVTKAFNTMQVALQSRSKHLAATLSKLSVQNERFDAALRNMSQGLCMLDADGCLVICNARFEQLYRLSSGVALAGVPLHDVLGQVGRDLTSQSTQGGIEATLRKLLNSQTPAVTYVDLVDGRTIAISCEPMSGGGWVTTHEDVTERRQSEARLVHIAQHDALTGLGNRVLFREKIEQALLAVQEGDEVAVLYLDLDRFKPVNDTLGHPVGDALLRAVAGRIRSCLREGDVAARLGGDEFAVIQIGAPQPDAAASLGHRLVEAIGAPYAIDVHQVVVGTSVGIALAPQDGTDPDRLMGNADMALYRAKRHGRGVYRFFEPAMSTEVHQQRSMELDLRRAVAKCEFQLHYQPIVSLATNEVTAVEALLRWTCPERGAISPELFIPLAEELGLIGQIGMWVLERACIDATGWPENVRLAVNISALQLKDPGLLTGVVTALRSSGLSAQRLEFELTETAMIHDADANMAALRRLREIGARISVDDFGTGYSSLRYLREFPVDKIKIDKSFVRDLPERADAAAIVRAVIGLGAGLGVCTTAEGVETRAQLELLRQAGCTEAQGLLLGKPVPVAELNQRLLATLSHSPTMR